MATPFIRPLLTALSPSGRRGRLSILIFHRVLKTQDPLFPDEPDVSRFDRICAALASWCNVIPLHEAVAGLKAGSLPARATCLTFDDGYADNYHNALPVLQRNGLHATFFVATGFLDGGRMWNDTLIEAIRATERDEIDLDDLNLGTLTTGTIGDKRATIATVIPALKHREPGDRQHAVELVARRCDVVSLPGDLMLTSTQLRDLYSAGMGIGAHTVSHPILARCDEQSARAEIAEGRQQLEAMLGERVGLFAYPNGKLDADYTREHVRIVRELGFDAAVSTNPGASRPGDDLFQLSRFTPWDREPWRFGLRLAQNLRRAPMA
jgi:peptidoglycan/xylan/chitin deacetylase (PgdA/CDA1 family)